MNHDKHSEQPGTLCEGRSDMWRPMLGRAPRTAHFV
jgi:hypothetical protein